MMIFRFWATIIMLIIVPAPAFVFKSSIIVGKSFVTSKTALSNNPLTSTKTSTSTSSIDTTKRQIRPSITDKARTIAHVCGSGTLCTTSTLNDVEGYPFGSYIDYILDVKGWPVMLLSEQSLHTQNIKANPSVSLFAQLPRAQNTQATAALSRVTIMGTVKPVEKEEENALKLAFSIMHPYAEQILDSPKFRFFHIKPNKIYFSGGFGVAACWVDVHDYELAKPDVMAHEQPVVMSRLNNEKKGELLLVCKHFLGLRISEIEVVRVQAIDRLGVDLRVKTSDGTTNEFRVGFRHPTSSSEDVKSEMFKLFHEVWEREQGVYNQPFKKTISQLARERHALRKTGSDDGGVEASEINTSIECNDENHMFDAGDGLPTITVGSSGSKHLIGDLETKSEVDLDDDLPLVERYAENVLRS